MYNKGKGVFYLERTISVEEKIRRAEEIYNRRRGNEARSKTARVNVEGRKNTSSIKKMRNQVIICALVYLIFYGLINSNFIFSEDLKNKVNEVLSYEVNFNEMYTKVSNYFNELKDKLIPENMDLQQNNSETNNGEGQNEQITNNIENQQTDNVENGTTENNNGENNNSENDNQENNETSNNNINVENIANINNDNLIENSIGGPNEEKEITEEEQMEQDANEIKNNINFIVPVQGTITSKFGTRNPTVSTVSKYHTGLDIGAVTGTDIVSATEGKVILRSDKGDYGKHLKIENSDVIIIYAHCSKLLVNEGDEVKQGQKIAEVGSTGNSTGPHLHFEIRKSGRYVDPQLILDV